MNNRTPYAYPKFPLRRFVHEMTDGPFGSSLTSSHYSDEGARVIRLGNIGSARFKDTDAAFIPMHYFQKLRRHEVKAGDLLIAGLGDDRHPVGRACIAPDHLGPAIVKADCYRARLDETRLTHRFAAWALGSSAVSDQVSALTRGSTRSRINLEVAREIHLPVPPVEEQRRIAEYLDAETARIDQLTVKREKQSSLLDEHFRAATYTAITGANQTGPRRASGIAWIGSLPSDWNTMPVNYQFEVTLGKMLNQERTKGDYLRPYLRNTNVQWDRIDTDDLLMMDFPPAEQERYKVLPGDLLVCEGGEPGRAAIWGHRREIYYQKALHRVRARGYSSPRWLYYCLLASTTLNVFATEGNSTTIAHLTGEQLKAHRFPFPDRSIQDKLVGELDALDRRQKKLSLGMIRQAQLLTERRQALITAAVTGQIDVSTASGRGIEE